MTAARKRSARGFTLIEVMVAVTILGLGLTMILSSQVGIFASVQRVQNETVAMSLLRCKMSELEVSLMVIGFQLTDQNDSGDCCEDEDTPGFSCTWKVETIGLPQPANLNANKPNPKDALKGASSAASAASSAASSQLSSQSGPNMGALGALSSLEQSNGAALGPNAKPADLASSFGAAAPGGPGGMATMAMGLVYPSLKPMLEASIRKVTVQVLWSEGLREKNFTVVQYITDPRKGSLNPAIPGMPGAPGIPGGPAGLGDTGSGTPPASPGTK